jgi:hypothetical protein
LNNYRIGRPVLTTLGIDGTLHGLREKGPGFLLLSVVPQRLRARRI